MEKEKIEIEVRTKKQEWIQILFLIILFFAIIALLSSTFSIYRYKSMLSNPLGYNLEKYNLAGCSCINENGAIVEITSSNPEGINSSDFFMANRPICQQAGVQLNFSNIKLG